MLSDNTLLMRNRTQESCLNPCSNGICSLTWTKLVSTQNGMLSLNPCSNGICSLTQGCGKGTRYRKMVLILVLMEYAL